MTRKYKNPQYSLRIPQELKSYLQREADNNRRSLNAEINDRLFDRVDDDSVTEIKLTSSLNLKQRVTLLEKRIEKLEESPSKK